MIKNIIFVAKGVLMCSLIDPQKYIKETSDMIVCPACLAEKIPQSAVKLNIDGQDVHFCHCPHCADLFKKNPDFYIKRLEGTIPNEGVLDHEGCCIRQN